MTAREEELVAREMLEKPELLGRRLKERRWAEVAALVRYVQHDVPPSLAMTDPALYQTLRKGVTNFYLRGGGALDLAKLEALAVAEAAGASSARHQSGSTDAIRDPQDSPSPAAGFSSPQS